MAEFTSSMTADENNAIKDDRSNDSFLGKWKASETKLDELAQLNVSTTGVGKSELQKLSLDEFVNKWSELKDLDLKISDQLVQYGTIL
jgi:hypothetical protein